MAQLNINVDLAHIQGEIKSIIFQSADDGFCILKLANQDHNDYTITGYCPNPQIGQPIVAQGSWIETKPVSYTHLTLPTILRV